MAVGVARWHWARAPLSTPPLLPAVGEELPHPPGMLHSRREGPAHTMDPSKSSLASPSLQPLLLLPPASYTPSRPPIPLVDWSTERQSTIGVL
eukprot:scaffold164515_cov46-Tisochrysis_lutea.AAC.1